MEYQEGEEKRGKEKGRIHTIAVETESDDGEEELDSANREVEIKSHFAGTIVI